MRRPITEDHVQMTERPFPTVDMLLAGDITQQQPMNSVCPFRGALDGKSYGEKNIYMGRNLGRFRHYTQLVKDGFGLHRIFPVENDSLTKNPEG